MRLLDSSAWHDISVQPVVGLAATVTVFWFAVQLQRRGRGHPLLNPTLIAVVVLSVCLKVAGVPYVEYSQSAATVSFMLSPAVVLLAVPLYRQRLTIWASGRVIAGALAVGSVTGVVSAVAIAWLLGADRQTLLSLAPKSTTAGIAIGISEKIGGAAALTAVLVIMTGIVGAVLGPLLVRTLASAIIGRSGWRWASALTASGRHGPCRSAKPRAPSPVSAWG